MAAMTNEEMKEYITLHMDSDLQFVLSDSGVSLDGQMAICRHYSSLKKFRAIGDTRPEVRRACFQDFGIPQDTPQARSETAAVVSAWETAQEYIAKETELRAEAKVSGQPRQLQTHERQAMVRAVEAVYGPLPEVEAPSADYLSLKAEETETNELSAAPLDEITSRKDSTTSSMQSTLDASGHVRITRTKIKSKVPSNTEEYRRVMRVETNAWLCMAARYKAKAWLHNLSADAFNKFVDYILGERVYGIQIPSLSGDSPQRVKPDWAIVLSYEHKLRKEALKLVMNEGYTLGDALKVVIKDADLKEAFFTTPIALRAALLPGASSSSGSYPPPQNKWSRPNTKGPGKGIASKGKSKGFSKGKQIRKELTGLTLAWRTPDNRELCFNYNSGGECSGQCGRVHQCRVKGCYGDHPAVKHKELVGGA